jgi:hypothetical protein
MYKTDKIGLAAFMCLKNAKLVEVQVKNRNRSTFIFDLDVDTAADLEMEFTRSDFSRYFDSFKYLRERTIRGS